MNQGVARITDFRNELGCAASPEHSHVKFKWLRIPEFDIGEIRVRRVRQHVPFAAYGSRWHEQCCALCTLDPFVSDRR